MKVALLATLVAAVTVATAGAVNEVVTLSLRQYVNANKVRVLVWYGQVSGSGGELVEVQARDCGTKPLLHDRGDDARRRAAAARSRARTLDPPYGVGPVVGGTDVPRPLGRPAERAGCRAAVCSQAMGGEGASPAEPGECTSITTAFR